MTEVDKLITNFQTIGLAPFLLKSLDQMKITVPTEIQSKTIPVALTGVDILASAETGSGKTLSYLIPMIHNLLKNEAGMALILTPTRELAMQVHKTIEILLNRNSIGGSTLLIIGGQSIYKQQMALRKTPKIIIGTPGRINDLLLREDLVLTSANFLVLDEIDRMLDMGFIRPIEKIVSHMSSNRQTFMFSATIPQEIKKLSQRFLKNPEFISANSSQVANKSIKQEVLQITPAEKFPQLLAELEKREGAVIIFVETKFGADKLADKLSLENHKSVALHGNLRQNRREQVVREFRDMYSRILVATDIAARGLDISHVKHVINYELPRCPEDYVHRIGRTGRAGVEGNAISFVVSDDDVYRWKGIFRIVGEDLPKLKDSSFAKKRSPFNSSNRYSRPDGQRSFSSSSRSFKPRSESFGESSAPRSFERKFSSDSPRPDFKREFKPRLDFGGDRPDFKREFKPRSDFGGDRPDFKREFKPRSDFGGDRPDFKREFKPRSDFGGDRPDFKREFKPRSDFGGDRPDFKREFKPRSDFGGDRPDFKREFKPRSFRENTSSNDGGFGKKQNFFEDSPYKVDAKKSFGGFKKPGFKSDFSKNKPDYKKSNFGGERSTSTWAKQKPE